MKTCAEASKDYMKTGLLIQTALFSLTSKEQERLDE